MKRSVNAHAQLLKYGGPSLAKKLNSKKIILKLIIIFEKRNHVIVILASNMHHAVT